MSVSGIVQNQRSFGQGPIAPILLYFYDLNGNVTNAVDAHGTTTLTEYDLMNRVTRTTRLMEGTGADIVLRPSPGPGKSRAHGPVSSRICEFYSMCYFFSSTSFSASPIVSFSKYDSKKFENNHGD